MLLFQTLFQAGAYNFQSISSVGEKVACPCQTKFNHVVGHLNFTVVDLIVHTEITKI